ncbi:cytochrome c [Mucilaginibacter sp. BJC16-A38]|uniref:c-type cytochrome n=1 Tax=Mucilaginibacter phenanthrenivorans TaxID=1234842 RepID=UPI00215846B7|nr:cytochrome c [Mucilaginibacter phenanthrenivorans]MCR8556290.1 cytochrome c [Mucilaginibacter phenanthrenivorans]
MKVKIIGCICFVVIAFAISCQSDERIEFNRYYSNGSTVYQAKCQNCHGIKGDGLQSFIPPLTDSLYLKNNKKTLACLLKNGLKGKVIINNKAFDGEMLPSGLTPLEIAQVLTYVTNSFGNKAATSTVETVNADLAKCN